MAKKEVQMEVIKKDDQMAAKNEKRQKMVDFLTTKIEAKETELQTKVYIIEGGKDIAEKVLDFLRNNAQWKFSEALGVIEAIKQVENAVDDINKGRKKDVFLPALALEAIYYFLTKVEGKGIASAESYIEILKPVSDSLGRSKQDRQEIDQLTRDRGTLEHAIDNGVDIEGEDDIIKEIQAELEPQI